MCILNILIHFLSSQVYSGYDIAQTRVALSPKTSFAAPVLFQPRQRHKNNRLFNEKKKHHFRKGKGKATCLQTGYKTVTWKECHARLTIRFQEYHIKSPKSQFIARGKILRLGSEYRTKSVFPLVWPPVAVLCYLRLKGDYIIT